FIFRNSLTVKNFLSISLVLSAVVFGATILYVLEGLVISRVTRLNREVNHIAQTGDLSARVTLSMRDELASLSANINQMLTSLEQAQFKRAELFEQVQAGQQSLQRLSRQLVEVQEVERHRIALELHDEIGQMLTGLKLLLDSGRTQPADQQAERLGQSLDLVNELIGRVRQISLELRPAMLDDFGLLPALIWQFDRYTAQTGVQVDFQHSGIQARRFPPPVETAAYRVVQEALTNAARHSGAREVSVRIWSHDSTLGLQMQDFGRGFDAETALAQGTSTGLFGMRERVALLDGEFEIEAAPGEGTCLTVSFPIELGETEADNDHHNSAG
ncbi:MAG TPA: sensor histidine kinase, partial [Anaerolineaceae bacterium]|nr:sensor histidine kinase [Anaerolineaceae bacterium]